jgi:hypothetical protein
MFYLGRSFATGDEPAKLTEFNKIWDLPASRAGSDSRPSCVVSSSWPKRSCGPASRTLPTETFLIITPFLSWGVIGGLLWFTTRFSRAGEQLLLATAQTA